MRIRPGKSLLFGLKSGAAKNAEKRVTRLKVVWILRNIVCDRQQRTGDRKTGKGVSLTAS
jgi:hypothetical protein